LRRGAAICAGDARGGCYIEILGGHVTKEEQVIDSSNPAPSSAHFPAKTPAFDNSPARAASEKSLSKDKSLSEWFGNPAVFLLGLSALTFVLYAGTLAFQFVLDDQFQIANNLLIRDWHNISRIFGIDMWRNLAQGPPPYYRPLLAVWWMLNYSLFGLSTSAWHLGAVMMHITAVATVFLLVRKLGVEYWTAAIAAMAFALHPVHVEGASQVCAVDPLLTVFFGLAFLAFLKTRETQEGRQIGWWAASLLLLACALFTKEVAVTFVGVVAAYVWIFPRDGESSWLERTRQCVLSALPYLSLVGGYLAIRKHVLHFVTSATANAHLSEALQTLPSALYEYVRMLVFPIGLGALYYTPYVKTLGLANFWLPLGAFGLFVLAIGYWWWRKRDRMVAFAGIWMAFTFAPVLYVIRSDSDFLHDRYLYLPSVGFVILVGKLVRLLPGTKTLRPAILQIAAACTFGAAYLVGSYATEVYWASNLLIFYRAHEQFPKYEYASMSYAGYLSERGEYGKAIELVKSVIQNHAGNEPANLFTANYALANLYLQSGDLTDGKATLAKAAALARSSAAPAQDTAVIARIYGQLGDYENASKLCAEALQRDSQIYSVAEVCGNIQLLAGRYDDAEKLLLRAVEAAPERPAPRFLLGQVYLQTGHTADAETYLRQAVERDPSVYDYHLWHARALAQRGNVGDARLEFLAALAIKQDDAQAKAGLAALPAGH
jgi:protein O-mannosyl-transferase